MRYVLKDLEEIGSTQREFNHSEYLCVDIENLSVQEMSQHQQHMYRYALVLALHSIFYPNRPTRE